MSTSDAGMAFLRKLDLLSVTATELQTLFACGGVSKMQFGNECLDQMSKYKTYIEFPYFHSTSFTSLIMQTNWMMRGQLKEPDVHFTGYRKDECQKRMVGPL